MVGDSVIDIFNRNSRDNMGNYSCNSVSYQGSLVFKDAGRRVSGEIAKISSLTQGSSPRVSVGHSIESINVRGEAVARSCDPTLPRAFFAQSTGHLPGFAIIRPRNGWRLRALSALLTTSYLGDRLQQQKRVGQRKIEKRGRGLRRGI
jgi:hypothetical protein